MSELSINTQPRAVAPEHPVPDDKPSEVAEAEKQRVAEERAAEAARVKRQRIFIGRFSLLVVVLTLLTSYIWRAGYEYGFNKEVLTSSMGLKPVDVPREFTAPVQEDVVDTIYTHCENVEAGGTDQGRFLYEPRNNTCYFGAQIDAHLKEEAQREAREKAQLNKALYELGRLSAERGVFADDSWRYLAQEFAATSKLPMAYEAGKQAFVDHGGDPGMFYPHIAKGGTLSEQPGRFPDVHTGIPIG